MSLDLPHEMYVCSVKDNMAGFEATVLTQDYPSKRSICFSCGEPGPEIMAQQRPVSRASEPRLEQKQVLEVSCLCLDCFSMGGAHHRALL